MTSGALSSKPPKQARADEERNRLLLADFDAAVRWLTSHSSSCSGLMVQRFASTFATSLRGENHDNVSKLLYGGQLPQTK